MIMYQLGTWACTNWAHTLIGELDCHHRRLAGLAFGRDQSGASKLIERQTFATPADTPFLQTHVGQLHLVALRPPGFPKQIERYSVGTAASLHPHQLILPHHREHDEPGL